MSDWVSTWLRGNGQSADGNPPPQHTPSSTHIPSADELRRKRLERLQALQSKAQVPIPAQDEKSLNADTDAILPKQTLQMASTQQFAPAESDKLVHAPLPSTKPSKSVATKRPYLEKMLQRILQLTMDPELRHTYLYLPPYTSMLPESESAHLNSSNYSEVLYARIILEPAQVIKSQDENHIQTPVAVVVYLEQCYYRCLDELDVLQSTRTLRSLDEIQRQEAMDCVESLKEMYISYTVTALIEPEIFPYETGTIMLDAWENVIRSQSNAHTPAFMERVAIELNQQNEEEFVRIFASLFQKLIAELFSIQPPSLFSNFYENLNLLAILCRIKIVAAVFTRINGFLLTPGNLFTGRRLQDATALGIVLRFSTHQDPDVQQMFSHITKRTKQEVDHNIYSLQLKMTSIQSAATDIFKSMLKAGSRTRNQVLQWLEQAMQVNAERAKESPDANITSTNGMMLNLTMVLLRLCGPLLSLETRKADLIDLKFLASSSLIFPADATKLIPASHLDTDASEKQASEDFNFVTRCFFLTARAVHLGPVAAITQYMRLARQLSFIQGRLNEDSDPRMRVHFEALVTSKIVMDAELLHPELVHELIRFALLSSYVAVSVCRKASTQIDQELHLPLPEPANLGPQDVLVVFPAHLVEDICAVLIFIARVSPKSLTNFALDPLLDMILIFLSSPSYIHSPHLRAKMSEVLYHVFLPLDEAEEHQSAASPLAIDLLSTYPLAQEHLAPCLLALYGDVEQTGFYEKLEHRYHIACLLRYLWKVPGHKSAFVRISEDEDKFVKFAHGLMNHINTLVTDALIALPEIKQLQEEMQDIAGWMALEEAVREQKQNLLADKERTVTSSLQLANETIHMMSYLTTEIQEPFLRKPELEERVVSMLNSVLVKLAGPRGLELKVNNPEQYRFRPKEMLKEVVETLLHFAEFTSFQGAVAVNGFYEEKIFSKCSNILRRTQLLPEQVIAKFDVFLRNVAQRASQLVKDEAMLGEIPDEFMDPLVCTLMKDPVILPTSGYTMDRATITQHLLNDQSDPFTRAPLTIDQLVPNVQLKAQVDAWMASIHESQGTE
uniref:RING-type E3 ubiquitin transferase n=1 Tax=Albugo laibachii Nc14 TaxID=890382 RepID=F0X1Z8_9STRA|nr:ubiquitin conjugation factor E4 putative [Albugo laibachii Nc14]|eukprot:CCA27857.1 ubiquitin conjugation factor E4 putative [Albugo laibachii Nc14]